MRAGRQGPAYGLSLALLVVVCMAVHAHAKKKKVPVADPAITVEPDDVKDMKRYDKDAELTDNDNPIEKSIFIPKNVTVKITADSLKFGKGVRIVVQGKLVAKNSALVMKSEDKKNPGVGISCVGGSLDFDGAEFNGLGNSEVQAGVVMFSDCEATIKACTFKNINATAVHGKNGKLTALRNRFETVNSTCMQLEGTFVSQITGSKFDGCAENSISIKKVQKPVTIENNEFKNSGAYAVAIEQCFASFSVKQNNFTGCYGAFKARSIMFSRDEELIEGSEFSENSIVNNDVDVSSDFYAKGNILYFDSVAATVSLNTISDNTFDLSELEKHNKKQAKDLTGSVMNMWDCAIKMERNTVARNKAFSRILTAGGLQKGESKYNLTENLFVNNTVRFVIFNDGPAMIDATKNFWGYAGASADSAARIPQHIFDFEDAPQQSGVVDFEPWLTEPRFDSPTTTTEEAKLADPGTGTVDAGEYGGDGYYGDDQYYGYTEYDDYGVNYVFDEDYADYDYDTPDPNTGATREPKHTIIKKSEEWKEDMDVVKNVIITKTGYLLIQPTDKPITIMMMKSSYIRVDGVLQIYGANDFKVKFTSDEYDEEGWRSIFFSSAAQPFNILKKDIIGGEEAPAQDWGCFISHAVFNGGGVMPKEEEQAQADDDGKKKKKKRRPLTPSQVGMVIVSGTSLYIEESEFSNSFSSGLVSSEHPNSTLWVTKKSVFKGNAASGIAHRSKTTLVVEHSTFTSNSEYAILTKQGRFNITNNQFYDNEGGVLCVAVKRSTVEKKADALDDQTSSFMSNKVKRNTFAPGDSCWSPDSDKEYRLCSFGSGSVNVAGNKFVGNLAPQEAVHGGAELVMLRVDKAVRFVNNDVEDSSGTIYLGSYFVREEGHVPNMMEVLDNKFARNNRFGVVITANARRVRISTNNITDCTVTDHAPFPSTPIVLLRGEQLQWPMDLAENEFLGNDGSQVFLRAQAPITAKDNLFDNPYMKAELWVEHADVKAPNNWWGSEVPETVTKRVRGPNGNATVSAGVFKNWMLKDGQYYGSASHLTENKEIPGYITPKRKSSGGAGAGVVVIVIFFVLFIVGLVVVFVKKSRGPSRPYKPVA